MAAADPTNTQWQRDLSLPHNNLGDLAQATDNLADAAHHYRRAIEIAQARNHLDVAADSLSKLAAIELDADRPADAIEPALAAIGARQASNFGDAVIDLRTLGGARAALGPDIFIDLVDRHLDADSRNDLIAALDGLPATGSAES